MQNQEYIFIIGATRGLGLYMTRHILQHTHYPIVITHRRHRTADEEEEEVKDIIVGNESTQKNQNHRRRLSCINMDVTSEESISSAARNTLLSQNNNNNQMKLLLSFPGVLHPERSIKKLCLDEINHSFNVNVIGNLLVMKHFGSIFAAATTTDKQVIKQEEEDDHTSLLLLPNFPIWACMSARLSSTTDNSLGGWYSYRASKAALNSVIKTFDIHLKRSRGFGICVGLHPGTVKTDLTKEFWESVEKKPDHKLFTPEEAAGNLWKVLCGLKKEEGRGKVWDWKGEEVPP